jgi:hypothetical protein
MNFEMNATIGAVIGIVIILVLIFGIGFLQRRPKGLKHEYFEKRWKELQDLCGSKNTWPLAIINADKLLDEALRKRRFKGKAMGERLVAAQRILTDNDGVWFGHKLRNRLVHEDNVKLKERDVKQALLGFRRALKDLGAL